MRDAVVRGGSLANVRALRSEWRRVRFDAVRATGVQLGEATLTDVTFEGARLDFSSFRMARLERVVFRDCRLEEADFAGATLESVLFERTPLTGATLSFARVDGVELRGCDLDGVSGAETLRGARMPLQDVLASATTLAGALGIQIVT